LQWIKFTTNAEHIWELGTKPSWQQTITNVIFDKQPFIGLKSFSFGNQIYALAFLTYACTNNYTPQNLIASPILMLPPERMNVMSPNLETTPLQADSS
jgi:hypothetical protein